MAPTASTAALVSGRYPLRWITLGAVLLTSFIGTWDGAAPVVALPAITRQFGVGIDSAVWVLTASSLLFAVPMAIFGKLGDMFGHKRIYLVATLSFAAFATLAGIAPSFGWLIFFRAMQGVTSAPAYTATMALIATTFPAEERGRAMGFMSMAASLAWAGGPPLGGLLMRALPWQSIILVEIPVTLIAVVLAWRIMPEDSQTSRPQFDLIGAGSLTASALVLMLGLRQVGQSGWTGGPTLMMAGVFVALIGVFLVTETRHKAPFVPLSLFANRRFSAATAFSATQLMTMFALTLLVPVYLLEVGGFDPAAAGLLVAGLSIARIFFEPIAGRIAELRGSRLPALIGIGLLVAIALAFALGLTPRTPGWLIFVGMFAFGVGISLGRTPVNAAVTHLVDRERLGLALGVFSMITFTGGALGQTFFGVLLRTLSGAGDAPLATAPRPDLLAAFGISFGVVVGVAVLAGIFGLRLPGRPMVKDVITTGD
ncbi:MAG: MFS transporter [Chloroflexi bacterium]|nr:MFS transporter [Chloroflexota bacterium]